MPTQPFDLLLEREQAKIQLKPVIDIASPVLQEAVNYATNVVPRCHDSKKGSTKEALSSLLLYLQIIQLTDSIEVLISNACVSPVDLLLRSAFEAKLSLEYIFERISDKRGIAWHVQYILNLIDSYEKMTPEHPKGKQFLEDFKEDRLSQFGGWPPVPETTLPLKELHEKLTLPSYSDIFNEFQRLRRKNNQYPNWYSVFGGPRNLKQLASHLGQMATYEILYRKWSREAHGTETSHISYPLTSGRTLLGPIRNPLLAPGKATMALNLLLESTEMMLKHFRSGELSSFRNWIHQEIFDKYLALAKIDAGYAKWFYEQFIQRNK